MNKTRDQKKGEKTMLLETTMRRGRHLLLSLTAVAFCYGLLATSVQACNLASKLAHPTAAAPLVLPQALTGVTTADEHPENGPRSIIGLWKVDVFLQGTQIDAGFESLYADGNELIVDQSPPATDNVCTGVWEQTG
ncbi:MAG: hypothetical protein JO211_15755, partial [Acidobacteriaceae bacterium]|nr:hypothetical protein [Acidobacteriaceae bacterium]